MIHKRTAGKVAETIVRRVMALAVGVAFMGIVERNAAAQERPIVQHVDAQARLQPLPAEAVRRNAKLQGLLQPSVKSWVENQARVESRRPSPDMPALEAAIRGRFGSTSGGGLPAGADIEAMAFVVMMEATNDQDNDLQEIMSEVQAQTKAKEFLRQQMQIVNTDVANNASQQVNKPCTTPACQQLTKQAAEIARVTAQTKKPVQINAGKLLTYGDLKSIQSNLQGSLDSMNEMSEMTSMRLQMAMDRRSKFVETLSNVLKKIDDTQDAIVQNLK